MTRSCATAFAQFPVASRALLESRELQRRVDTKFVSTSQMLASIAPSLENHYAMLACTPSGFASYRSLYFDTPDLQCFHDHRRGRRIRHKLRIRHYTDRECSFFEIKTRRNDLVTDKRRCELPYGQSCLGTRELAFAGGLGVPADALAPVMWIEYRRLALIGVATLERVTLDVDLELVALDGARYALGDLAVIEVKQATSSSRTPVMLALGGAGLREQSLSKYAAAVAGLFPDVRRNRLLPSLRQVPVVRRLPDLPATVTKKEAA